MIVSVDTYLARARKLGFTAAVPLDPGHLECRPEIRALCVPGQCPSYGKSWICPPGCGELDACAALLRDYSHGILLQSRFAPVNAGDKALADRLAARHNRRLWRLANTVSKDDPSAFLLSTGGCRRCANCTFPSAPCRRPEPHRGSLSAFGIDVEALCTAAGLDFSFAPDALCFVGCLLMRSV